MKLKYHLIWMVIIVTTMPILADNFGTFAKDSCIDLLQTCDNCTYVNISSVDYPNSSSAIKNVEMTKDGTRYNYTFCNTSDLGTYIVNTYGDVNGKTRAKSYDFEVTYTGDKVSSSNTIIVGALLILAIICLVLGYNFETDYWLLKTFFYFCSVLTGIVAVNSARIIASESSSLLSMSNMGLLIGLILFGVFFIFMFVFAFIEIIKALREKRGVRWNYD